MWREKEDEMERQRDKKKYEGKEGGQSPSGKKSVSALSGLWGSAQLPADAASLALAQPWKGQTM